MTLIFNFKSLNKVILKIFIYRVGIEHTEGEEPGAYTAATAINRPAAAPATVPAPVPEEPPHAPDADSSSDSD